MQSVTFRTQLLMNGITLVLVSLIVFVSTTFANSQQQDGAQATQDPSAALNQQASSDFTTISYQGHLTDADGETIDDTLPMEFRLYADPKDGDALWTEERTGTNAVPVKKGLFKVMLGSVEPLSMEVVSQELWLGISVDGDSEMTPREQVGRVPSLLPGGSVTSDKLNLQHGTVCLAERVNIDVPGDYEPTDIPGLSLDFTLDKPAAVLIWMEGMARFNAESSASDDIQFISLVLDDDEGNAGNIDGTNLWYGLGSQSIVQVDSGTHTLKAVASAKRSRALTVVEKQRIPYKYMASRTCINYLVLGEQ